MNGGNILVIFISTINAQLALTAWSSSDERTIRSLIFNTSNYDRLTRPAEITNVSIAFNLLTINNLDIKTQQLSSTGWLTVEWIDSRLTWNVATGTESNYVFSTTKEIWYPEIFVDNSLADVNVISDDNLLYKVKYDGKVDWEVPRIFTTYCEVDITYFPFDTQTCTIEVTSWAYNKKQLILQPLKTEVNVEDFKQHGEFIYKGSTVSTSDLSEHMNDGTVQYFTLVDFNLVLERRPFYYVLSMILPVILTSYLMVVVFVLPANSGEKVGFAQTILLAVTVLLTLIFDQMPSTAIYISVFSMFLMINLVSNVVSVMATILIMNIYHRDDEKKISPAINSMAKTLAKLSFWDGCRKNKGDTIIRQIKVKEEQEKGKEIKGKKVKLAFEEIKVDVLPKLYSWKEIASILDWFLFVYTFIFTNLLTFLCLVALCIGGAVN